MKTKIRGTTLQVLDIELDKGEAVFTESGGMSWMTPNINMNANVKGGLLKGIGRMFSGESLFLVDYKCEEGTGLITFSSEMPGKIVPLDLKKGESIICQRDAFMVAQEGVDLKLTLTKRLGAGFFGGEGFFLQQITGPGKAFLELAGEITEYSLKEGQTLKVDPQHIGAYEPSVDFDITRIKGVKNMFFGGEGIFLGTLTGPGKVWLQSMPIKNLAMKLYKYMPKPSRS
ncbi:MAG: hypothetical protein ACI83O_000555 [Patescibacteria group bacterium]|jgi:uncharacterized protein (TIGR00266 family)